ncbi:ISPsy25, transposase, partial [Pseudomonas amygdali pv. photiniae]
MAQINCERACIQPHRLAFHRFRLTLAATRDITVYLRDGSFASVGELERSITTFMALRNAQPTRYVWNAKGEEILNRAACG